MFRPELGSKQGEVGVEIYHLALHEQCCPLKGWTLAPLVVDTLENLVQDDGWDQQLGGILDSLGEVVSIRPVGHVFEPG